MSDFGDFDFGGDDGFDGGFDDGFGEEGSDVEEQPVAEESAVEESAAEESAAEESGADHEGDHDGDHDGEKGEHHMEKGEHHDGMMHHDSPFEMMMKVETLMRWSAIDPFMGNLTYLLVAAGVTTHAALMAFRYTSRTGYYNAFLSGTGTNWFEIGDMIQNYANLSLFGIAFITQLLALFGILTWLNALVWFWGIMLAGGLANGVGAFFKFLAYDNCWDKATGCDGTVKADMIAGTAMSTSVSLTLYMQAENWMWGVWEGQTQEEKDAQVEQLLMEVEEWEAEVRAEMEAEMEKEGDAKAEESAAEEEEDVEEEDAEEETEEPKEDTKEDEDEEEEKEDPAPVESDDGGDDFGDDGFGDDEFGDDGGDDFSFDFN